MSLLNKCIWISKYVCDSIPAALWLDEFQCMAVMLCSPSLAKQRLSRLMIQANFQDAPNSFILLLTSVFRNLTANQKSIFPPPFLIVALKIFWVGDVKKKVGKKANIEVKIKQKSTFTPNLPPSGRSVTACITFLHRCLFTVKSNTRDNQETQLLICTIFAFCEQKQYLTCVMKEEQVIFPPHSLKQIFGFEIVGQMIAKAPVTSRPFCQRYHFPLYSKQSQTIFTGNDVSALLALQTRRDNSFVCNYFLKISFTSSLGGCSQRS